MVWRVGVLSFAVLAAISCGAAQFEWQAASPESQGMSPERLEAIRARMASKKPAPSSWCVTTASFASGTRPASHRPPGKAPLRWRKRSWAGCRWPDGRARLSPASRSGRVPGTSSNSPGRTRPTSDGFMGRVHGSQTKGASHEPDGRARLSPASRFERVPGTSSNSPGRTRPTSDGFMGRVHGSQTKGASHEPDGRARL
ncbi:MAG: hypothetical protein FJ398_19225, partial [Verrucomicrobia bacterium]|nr:hypothetical protein [Verrucomicrobiota bacterium]